MLRIPLLLQAATYSGWCMGQSICQIQGSGASSPYDGQTVTTQGVVTAVFSGSGSLNGYFIEEPECDEDASTSNGIFVYDPTPGGISIGQRISVSGVVDEFNGTTEITNANYTVLGSGGVVATDLVLPIAATGHWERYEGMFLRFPGTLTVTDNQGWVQYGELHLAPQRTMTPTDAVDPNDAVATGTTTSGSSNVPAVTSATSVNDRSNVLLDDGRTNAYPVPLPWAGVDGTLRCGSTVQDLQGVLHYAYGEYRLEPIGPLFFEHDPRPTVPVVGGTIRAASLNVLNYFSTLGGWGAANIGEMSRQRTKLVAALQALNADVIALCELENNDVAWSDLLAGLNAAVGTGMYSGMEEDGFGGGTRTVVFYKPAVLTPVTQLYWLGTSIFQRPHLTQGFEVNATGTRFLFSTMHLRSKLCDNAQGLDMDQGDGQGCYNDLRKAQASALVQHWSGLRASTGIAAQLIMGDHNAYSEEDPNDVLRAAGLVDLVGTVEHTHAYDGAFGALDHAFATVAMHGMVTGAHVWHINSDEPEALDYHDANLSRYQPNAFRCSDHDPVLVGIEPGPVGMHQEELRSAVRVAMDGRTVSWVVGEPQGSLLLELFSPLGALIHRDRTTLADQIGLELRDMPPGPLFWRLCTGANGALLGAGSLLVPDQD
ncbi:MAG: ExeM/NucH family extracellular endonuclease [Flavobacteriales bacterium]|nr:ExeM/NucH family extracellular endonuclease [Flavobacteriales bacterium]